MLLMQRLFPMNPLDFGRGDLDQFVRRVFSDALPESAPRALPALNVWEDDAALFVEAELPGLRLEDIEILVQAEELTIKGRREPATTDNERVHRRERFVGEFERSVTLPTPIDAEKVEASLLNGVLHLRLPKAATAVVRRIPVKAG
jgi:HSP20 family protein